MDTQTNDVKHLVPTDAQYSYDEATNTARIEIETRDPSTGKTGTASVFARLSVYQSDDYMMLDADYVSHQGYASDCDIAYALRAIETNDLGIGLDD